MSTIDSILNESSNDEMQPIRVLSREESLAMIRECLEDGLEKLPEQERAICEMRFGLSDGEHRPLEEIMAKYDITKEDIRKLEKQLFSLCKNPPHFQRKTKLRNFLD